jgi:hypothetical protein
MKCGLNEKKHLLWQKGGVPTIDRYVWEEYRDKVDEIYIRTAAGRRFRVKAEEFDRNKQLINLGHGDQYWIEKDKWDIYNNDNKKYETNN